MKEFEELKSVIHSLSESELKDVYQKLSLKKGQKGKNISLKLVELIANYRQDQLIENNEFPFGNINQNSFRKLIYRVLEKIYDVYLLRESIVQNNLYDDRTRDIFLLERELIISEILRYKGLFKLANRKLTKVVAQSKFYEHYDILLYALEKKRRWVFLNLTGEENKSLNQEIEFYNEARLISKYSNEIFLKAIRFNSESFDEHQKRLLKNEIIKLSKYFNKSKSNNVKYYLLFLKVQLNNLSYNFEKALLYIDELIDFVLLNRNIYSKYRYGNLLLNKGLLFRNIFQFDLSLHYIKESKKYLSDKEYDNIIIYEQLYLTNYFIGDLGRIKYYLSNLEGVLKNENIRMNDFNKFNYYLGIYHFINKDFEKSSSILNKISSKNGSVLFTLSHKTLLILNYIEMYKFDLADANIEGLRKYLSRVKLNENVLARKKPIQNILNYLSSNSYDFKKVKAKQEKSIDILTSVSKYFRPNDYEMIPFHEWFESKVKGIPYDHAEAMKRLNLSAKARKKA